MSSAALLEVIAQGSSNGTFGALTQTGTGGIVAASAAGTYTITCDGGLLGDNASVSHARVVITIVGGAANSNVAGVAKAIVGGQLQISFTTQVAAGAAANEGFDYIIYRDPNQYTLPGT